MWDVHFSILILMDLKLVSRVQINSLLHAVIKMQDLMILYSHLVLSLQLSGDSISSNGDDN